MRNASEDFSSGEKADFSDLELDPETGQIVSVSADGEQVPIEQVLTEESEPASMLTADRLLRDEARHADAARSRAGGGLVQLA